MPCCRMLTTPCFSILTASNQPFLAGNASSVVTHTDTKVFFNGKLDFHTGLHLELVNTVAGSLLSGGHRFRLRHASSPQPTEYTYRGVCAHVPCRSGKRMLSLGGLYCIVVVCRYQFVLFHSCFLFYLFCMKRTAALCLLSLK